MSETVYCGCDVGLKGAIAFLGGVMGSKPFKAARLPLIASGKRQEVDTKVLWQMIAEGAPNLDTLMVIIEECAHHQPSQAAMRSQALSFGKVLGMLEQHGVRYHCVMSQTWQRKVIGKIPKGMTKLAAQGKAKRLWPSESSMFTEQNDGTTDAALLCEYGRMSNL